MVRTQATVKRLLSCVSSEMFFQVVASVSAVVTVGTGVRPAVVVPSQVLREQQWAGGGETAHRTPVTCCNTSHGGRAEMATHD